LWLNKPEIGTAVAHRRAAGEQDGGGAWALGLGPFWGTGARLVMQDGSCLLAKPKAERQDAELSNARAG
jgi:hypothetical protein